MKAPNGFAEQRIMNEQRARADHLADAVAVWRSRGCTCRLQYSYMNEQLDSCRPNPADFSECRYHSR